jgi:hypothetical protein
MSEKVDQSVPEGFAWMVKLEHQLIEAIVSRNGQLIRRRVRLILNASHRTGIGVPASLVTLIWDAFDDVDRKKKNSDIDLLRQYEDESIAHDMWFAAAAYHYRAEDKAKAILFMDNELPYTDISTIRTWTRKFDMSFLDRVSDYDAEGEFFARAKAYNQKKAASKKKKAAKKRV